jgi:uncharacterized protein with PQ loop repeat
MQLYTLAEATGYLGSVLGVAMVVPQIVRTYRNRALPGVSATAWALTALSCTTWMLYGIRAAEVPQIPGNVLLVSGAVVVVLAVPSRASVARRALLLASGGAALTAAAFLLPPAGVGFVAFGIGLVSALPQTVMSLRRRDGESAVSVLTWALRVASQACWLAYALARHDLVVTISASFLLTSALVIIATELARQPGPRPAARPALATAP